MGLNAFTLKVVVMNNPQDDLVAAFLGHVNDESSDQAINLLDEFESKSMFDDKELIDE